MKTPFNNNLIQALSKFAQSTPPKFPSLAKIHFTLSITTVISLPLKQSDPLNRANLYFIILLFHYSFTKLHPLINTQTG